MRVIRDPDLPAFAEQILPHLLADPVSNNLACDIVQVRRDGHVPVEPDALWLRVLDTDGVLAGVALRTPPRALLLTDMPPAAVDALAAHLTNARPPRCPGSTARSRSRPASPTRTRRSSGRAPSRS